MLTHHILWIYSIWNIQDNKNQSLLIDSANLTVNKGTIGDANLTHIEKSGHVVWASLYLTGVTSSSWETIAILPYKPTKQFYAIDMSDNSAWRIDTDGKISRYGTTTNKTIHMAFSYMTNS